ncbi:2226_t:CDS:2 [Funneliformis mosseae]|uniref:2226_t:CDS:1 n=1 Tax=Funneliformis mosseae TaxID=27381 RepID=A0A9N8V1E5_FUNMO|nr:2226_t:CDS:2 [Funneliformis mosseae]
MTIITCIGRTFRSRSNQSANSTLRVGITRSASINSTRRPRTFRSGSNSSVNSTLRTRTTRTGSTTRFTFPHLRPRTLQRPCTRYQPVRYPVLLRLRITSNHQTQQTVTRFESNFYAVYSNVNRDKVFIYRLGI